MIIQDERHSVIEYQSMLREYYSRYLTEVRGLSLSSVKHYLDALNNISRRLKEKELIKHSIYEISSLELLNYIRDVLYADSDFVAMNERGKRMYSAGLNTTVVLHPKPTFMRRKVKCPRLMFRLLPKRQL